MNLLASARHWVTDQTTRASTRALHKAALEATPAMPPEFVRACAVCTLTRHRRTPVRAAFLNPYMVDLLAEDLQHCGPGVRLEVMLTSHGGSIRAVERALAPLRRRGVTVRIRRPAMAAQHPAAATALARHRALAARG